MYLGLGRGERLLPGIQIKRRIMKNINNSIHKNIVTIETHKSFKGFVIGLNVIQSKIHVASALNMMINYHS